MSQIPGEPRSPQPYPQHRAAWPPQPPTYQQPVSPGHVYGQPPKQPKKKSHLGLILGILIPALVLLCGIGGCAVVGSAFSSAANDAANPNHAAAPAHHHSPADNGAPAETGPAALDMGDTLQVGSDSGASANITVLDPQVTTAAPDAYSDPPANGYFVTVTLTVVGKTGKFDLSSDSFYVKTRDGSRYDTTDGNAWEITGAADLSYVEINGGEHKTGPVAFDISARHGQVLYDPNLTGKPLAAWSF